MRTRNHDWLDTARGVPLFGVQVFHDGQWKHAAIDGKPIICVTEIERDQQRMKLRNLLRGQNVENKNAVSTC